mgnify:CR=1 FL=1
MSDTGNVWTEERLEELKKLWAQGLSISQIGEALGVSRNAIAGKAHRMGLPKRPSPISKTVSEAKKPSKPKAPAEPVNLYGRAKLQFEAALQALEAELPDRAAALRQASGRWSNAIGGAQLEEAWRK